MANFNVAKPLIAALEGGLSNNPNDNAASDPAPNGFHTNKGITWKTFKACAKQFGYAPTEQLFMEMPQTIVDSISKVNYWDALKLDAVNSNKKAYLLFDFAFNSGTVTAIREAQSALGIAVDGVAGPQFLAAVNRSKESDFAKAITETRVAFIRESGKIKASLKPGLIERAELLLKKNFQPV